MTVAPDGQIPRPPRSRKATRAIITVAAIIAALCLLGGALLVAAALLMMNPVTFLVTP